MFLIFSLYGRWEAGDGLKMLSSGVGTISTIEIFNTTTFIFSSNLHSVRQPGPARLKFLDLARYGVYEFRDPSNLVRHPMVYRTF